MSFPNPNTAIDLGWSMAMERMATPLLVIVGLALLFPSSCKGTTWSMVIEDPRGGNTSHALQPSAFPLPDGVTGAESLAFDRRGNGPYAGVSDGRVLRWNGRAWTTFAYSANYLRFPMCNRPGSRGLNEDVCGRPLGLQFFEKTGELYIADAYLGLMKARPRGGVAAVLATRSDDGAPFTFVNGLDVYQATGDAYFTDSSAKYQRRDNDQVMRSRDATGRLLRYDARTRRVTVLASGLQYPNGVAVSDDGSSVAVAHTWPSRVFRYWIRGAKAGTYELLADVPGYPDNLRRDGSGGFWVALNREKLTVNNNTVTPPPPGTPHLVGVRINGDGEELALLTAPEGVTLSDVAERDGAHLWLGSVELDYVGLVDYRKQ